MIEYKVQIDPQNNIIIQGDFAPGSIAVNIPDTNKKKKQFVSLFLNKKDIEHGIEYLRCISNVNPHYVNEGLFIAGLSMFAKCFVATTVRTALDKEGFKIFSHSVSDLFTRYDEWRNKHFMHDENRMTEAMAFLLISPEDDENIFGGPPSVVWNSVQIDYIQEGRQLEFLLHKIWDYIAHEIDKKGDCIANDYCNCSREELLKYGKPPVKLATTEEPGKKR